jgi:lipoate-protein ligase A
MLKKAYTEASKVVVNSDGLTEDMQAQMTPEEFHEKIEKGFQQYKKEFMAELDKRTLPNGND